MSEKETIRLKVSDGFIAITNLASFLPTYTAITGVVVLIWWFTFPFHPRENIEALRGVLTEDRWAPILIGIPFAAWSAFYWFGIYMWIQIGQGFHA